MKPNVLITGGTGLIGKHLTTLLLASGYKVSFLSRKNQNIPNVQTFLWNVEKGEIATEALEKADYIIHLAGANVAEKTWTAAYKKEILESRTQSTEVLYQNLQKIATKPKAFISASAIGIYGNTGDTLIDEDSPFGNDFLAEVTKVWEKATDKIDELGIRTVKLRIGVVLSAEGGALTKMAQPIRLGAGAGLGSGKQFLSWIHIDDLAAMFAYTLQNENISGIYNAVGKNPITNLELTQAIAKQLKMPLLLPNIPSFALKLLLGEMAEMVLNGSKISSKKIENAGFQFKFADINDAVRDLFR